MTSLPLSAKRNASAGPLLGTRGKRAVLRGWARLVRARIPGGLALDLGCGSAELGPLLGPSFTTIGVDLELRQRLGRIPMEFSESLVKADATALPLRSRSFDLVIALDVFEHIADSASLASEVTRVLKSKGWLFVSTPNPDSWGRRLKGTHWFGYRDPSHVNIRPRSYWEDVLRRAGLSVIAAGTDRLWDSPYLRRVPATLQRLGFGMLSRLMLLPSPLHRWPGGENTLLICQRTGDAAAQAGGGRHGPL